MAELYVRDSSELSLLLRALLEAKFARLANDWELSGSPIVADLARRAERACSESDSHTGITEAWRQLTPKHSYWPVALARALEQRDLLEGASESEQESHVEVLLAPFRTDASTVAAFLSEVRTIIGERRWYQLWLRPGNPFGDGLVVLRQQPSGTFVALDASGKELAAAGRAEKIGEELLARGLEPFGYFILDE